jgi:putative endonuclease
MKIPGFAKSWLRLGSSPANESEPAGLAHLELGRRGETLAAEYLEAIGYRLVAANFSVPIGRNLNGAIVRAEVDLVGYDGETLCFVEVKTRASDWYAAPQVNVDLRKQRQIIRAARAYRRLFGLLESSYRFDVITVTLAPVEAGSGSSKPRLELLKNFWTKDKFRKRRWHEGNFDPA